MLTGKQKRYLRREAHHLSPIFQVGKGGVNENMVKQISEALEARELIKVSVLQNCEQPKEEVAEALAGGARAELVQTIETLSCCIRSRKKIKKLSFLNA